MAWVNEVYDKLYAPNTVCVACISHGKDSLAMLRAIKLLGLPLHRIVTTDVWATQDIPAELPPMWEWKKKADKIIKGLYGIEVEHLCAMAREKSNEVAQTDGSLTKQCSTSGWKAESSKEPLKDSRKQLEHGAKKSNTKKLTYENIFYRRYKEGGRYGFATLHNPYCRGELKILRLSNLHPTRSMVSEAQALFPKPQE